jgi:hypothetical protein
MSQLCDVPSCQKEASEVITELALQLCDWHAYEHHNDLGWIGKMEEDNVKNTIPNIKDKDKGLT